MQQNIFSIYLSKFLLINSLPICLSIAALLCKGICIKGMSWSWTFNLPLFVFGHTTLEVLY